MDSSRLRDQSCELYVAASDNNTPPPSISQHAAATSHIQCKSQITFKERCFRAESLKGPAVTFSLPKATFHLSESLIKRQRRSESLSLSPAPQQRLPPSRHLSELIISVSLIDRSRYSKSSFISSSPPRSRCILGKPTGSVEVGVRLTG